MRHLKSVIVELYCMFAQCRAKGSIVKRLHQYKVDSAREQEQRLADESGGKSSSSSHSSSSEEDDKRKTAPRKGQIKDPHPPGFRYLISRVEKFSGNQGDDDFELWLMDFNETTRNCGWTDE